VRGIAQAESSLPFIADEKRPWQFPRLTLSFTVERLDEINLREIVKIVVVD
jgi:hypothetical protein